MFKMYNISDSLLEEVLILFERGFFDFSDTPEIGGQEFGGVLQSREDGFQTIGGGLRASSGGGIAIFDTSEL
jgi:hypothetical protein